MNLLRSLFKKSPFQAMSEFVEGYDAETVEQFCKNASFEKKEGTKEIKLIVPDNALIGTVTIVSEMLRDGSVNVRAFAFLTDGADVEIKWG